MSLLKRMTGNGLTTFEEVIKAVVRNKRLFLVISWLLALKLLVSTIIVNGAVSSESR